MLKLSTKGRYGLRAMIELAQSDAAKPVLMGDIAKSQGFSRKYLHALLTSLKDAGLVRSVRGAKGGYLLAKTPDQIRISEVFHALEGASAVIDCVDDGTTCERSEDCSARDMWKKLNEAIVGVLNCTTLADLAEEGVDNRSESAHCTVARGTER